MGALMNESACDFMDKSPIGLVGQEKKQRQDKAVTPLWKKWG
jgi:hypothetical protein